MEKIFHCKHDLEPICGRLCNHDNITHLITRLALIEGSILERLESEKIIAIRELMEEFEWEPCAIAMAIGSLVRQGIIQSREQGQDIFIEALEKNE